MDSKKLKATLKAYYEPVDDVEAFWAEVSEQPEPEKTAAKREAPPDVEDDRDPTTE